MTVARITVAIEAYNGKETVMEEGRRSVSTANTA